MNPPLTPKARALVAAGRAELEPSPSDLERVRGRILLAVGATVAAGTAAAVSTAQAAGAAGAGAGYGASAAAAGYGASGGAAGAGANGALGVGGAAGAGTTASVAASAATASAGAAAGSGLSAGLKIGLVLFLAGAGAGGGALFTLARGPDTEPASSPHSASAPPPRPQPAAIAVPPPAAPPSGPDFEFEPDRVGQPPPRRGRKPAPAAPPRQSETAPPADTSLSQELTLVRRARAALRLGMPDRALELLAEHGKRFPAARLAQEAAVVHIEAMCAVGDRARARALTVAFARDWPRSPLRARVWKMCGASVRSEPAAPDGAPSPAGKDPAPPADRTPARPPRR